MPFFFGDFTTGDWRLWNAAFAAPFSVFNLDLALAIWLSCSQRQHHVLPRRRAP